MICGPHYECLPRGKSMLTGTSAKLGHKDISKEHTFWREEPITGTRLLSHWSLRIKKLQVPLSPPHTLFLSHNRWKKNRGRVRVIISCEKFYVTYKRQLPLLDMGERRRRTYHGIAWLSIGSHNRSSSYDSGLFEQKRIGRRQQGGYTGLDHLHPQYLVWKDVCFHGPQGYRRGQRTFYSAGSPPKIAAH